MADPSPAAANVRSRVERTFREESGRALATLIRLLGGDFEAAEEAVADAFVAALETWPRDGIPANPGAWITTSARNRALDRVRRARRYAERLIQIEADLVAAGTESTVRLGSESHLADDRLRLIFTCCHPALALDARVALTLRTLGGLTTPEIARAFLLPEATLAQRIVRAKRKIRQAGIPYRVPPDDLLAERLDGVLAVLYLVFNEGYAATGGGGLVRHDLCAEAIRLARLLGALLPRAVEARGLLALLLLQDSRRRAGPTRATGASSSSRSRIDRAGTARNRLRPRPGRGLLPRPGGATSCRGPTFVQAAIAACHARSASAAATPWPRSPPLYGLLATVAPGPVVELNRAVAIAMADGPAAGLVLVERWGRAGALADYHSPRPPGGPPAPPGPAPRGPQATNVALALATNAPERAFLARRLARSGRRLSSRPNGVGAASGACRGGSAHMTAHRRRPERPPGERDSVSRRTCRGPPCRREVPAKVPIERSFAMMTTSPPRPASGADPRAPGHDPRRRRRRSRHRPRRASPTACRGSGPRQGRSNRRRWGSDVEGQPAVAGSPPAPPTFPSPPWPAGPGARSPCRR